VFWRKASAKNKSRESLRIYELTALLLLALPVANRKLDVPLAAVSKANDLRVAIPIVKKPLDRLCAAA